MFLKKVSKNFLSGCKKLVLFFLLLFIFSSGLVSTVLADPTVEGDGDDSHAIDGPVCVSSALEIRTCDAWCSGPGAWCDAASWTSSCPLPAHWYSINGSQTPVTCCVTADCIGDCRVCTAWNTCGSAPDGTLCSSGICESGICRDPEVDSSACFLYSPTCTGTWCYKPLGTAVYDRFGRMVWSSGTTPRCCGNGANEIPRQSFYSTCYAGDGFSGTGCVDYDGSYCGTPGCTYSRVGCPSGGDVLCCAPGECGDCTRCVPNRGEPTCGSGWWCNNERWVSRPICCYTHDYARCEADGNLWWYDSCDVKEDMREDCLGLGCAWNTCNTCNCGPAVSECCSNGCNADPVTVGCAGGTECGLCDGLGNCVVGFADVLEVTLTQDCVYDNIILDRSSTDLYINSTGSVTLKNAAELHLKTLSIDNGAGDAVFIEPGTSISVSN